MRCFSRLLLLVVCSMLASCIDGYEEYWIGADGGGRAQIHYEVPAAIASSMGGEAGISKLLDAFIRDTPTLTNATRQVTRRGDRLTVDFNASFKSVLELIVAVSGDSALSAGNFKSVVDPLVGHFEIQQSGRSVEMTRTIRPSKALPGSFLMPASQFEGRRLVYILHLPMASRESNATRTADGGRTLIWDLTLQEGLKNPVTIHFKAVMPVPRWILAALAAALVLLGWLGHRRIRRRRSALRTT